MPLNWPSLSNVNGDIPADTRTEIHGLLDRVGDRVLQLLAFRGLPRSASPLFLPWSLFVVLDNEKVIALFAPLGGGVSTIRWIDRSSQLVDPRIVIKEIQEQFGLTVTVEVSFPRGALGGTQLEDSIATAAMKHFLEIDQRNRFEKLGDLTGLGHLEPFFGTFLADHPDPAKNVFLMMRFRETDQFKAIHEAIRNALKERGFDAIRADDRDYTGDLWLNVQLCMTACSLGIAVFEDIHERDFNPNVSLELGYMFGRQKRCLLLKEQNLPVLPADVIHRLYKPFDVFSIADTVRLQVIRWIDVDLGGATAP